MRSFFFAFLLPVAVTGLHAQGVDSTLLTIDRIFASGEFRDQQSPSVQWQEDGRHYLVLEPTPHRIGLRDIVRYDADREERQTLVSADSLLPPHGDSPLRISSYSFTTDGRRVLIFTNTKRVWRQNTRGDYWLVDTRTWTMRKLGGDVPPSSLMFAKFSPDGNHVAYVHAGNIYVENIDGHVRRQLTTDGSATVVNGTFDWVYEEEFDLRDGYRWSPDSKALAYWQIDASKVKTFYLVNNTDSLYPVLTSIPYPKVGDTLSAYRIGVVDIGGGPTRWCNIPGDPRNSYIARMEWADGSSELLLQHLNRLQNTLTVLLADARSGATRTVFTERDSAWVDLADQVEWIRGRRELTWISERDGWRHVYAISRDGSQARRLTREPFDVIQLVTVDESGGWIYYLASPANATQAYLYRSRIDGEGSARRLTPQEEAGTHSYVIAPGGQRAIHTWSSFGVPPTTSLIVLPDHRVTRTLVDNAQLRQKLSRLASGKTEFFRVPIGDGVELDGWRMLPPNFSPAQKCPVLVYVYGEPAGQTVLDRWEGNRYLWHLLLTQKGYIVASVDNRGTPAPRGRAWRKSIYRQIGILASQDQAAAVRAMRQWGFVDSSRVGVWGWSGGGSMSLNGIFRYPDLYATAMSVAAVPDQRLYDAIYQERYMGLPNDNAEGYRLGSPITFADSLRGNLLIVHGTGDDNVHYQGAERLMNALIKANKQFTVMPYPNRSHGIFERENTTRHLYTLLTTFLLDHMPPSPTRRND